MPDLWGWVRLKGLESSLWVLAVSSAIVTMLDEAFVGIELGQPTTLPAIPGFHNVEIEIVSSIRPIMFHDTAISRGRQDERPCTSSNL